MVELSNETKKVLEHLNDVIVFKNKISSFADEKEFIKDTKFQQLLKEVKDYADFVSEIFKKDTRTELEALNEAF